MGRIIRISIIIFLLICATVPIITYKYINKGKKSLIEDINNSEGIGYDEYSDEYFLQEYDLAGLNLEEKERIRKWEIHGAYELILLMCEKNGDWSKLPISKETREQYNEKDGLLKNFEFDSIELDPEIIDKYPYDSPPAQILITKGNEKDRIYVDYSFYSGGIHQVEITDVIRIVDEHGNKLNEGFPFDEKHIEQNFETWVNVGLTDKYVSNHGTELLDLFTHYSPLDYNPITFVKTKSKLNNHMAYFIVTSVLECKEREYEVYYKLDENNYLDDAYAVCVKEKELEATNTNSGAKAFYLNSNLENTNLSYEFKQYIKEHGSYNSDIKDIYINKFADEVCLDEGVYTKFIRCYKMNNGDTNSYFVEYEGTETEIIYNINSTKLPYKNISAKEVKELYLKDIGNKNN